MQIAPILVTYTNDTEKAKRFIQSAQHYGWNLEVLLVNGEYPGANAKFKAILESIPRLRARGLTHLVSIDAFDTVVVNNMQHFLGRMHDLNFPALVLAAETNLFPDKERLDEWPVTGTRWRFVNSPFILDLRQPIPAGFEDIGDDDDQRHLCNWYLDKGRYNKNVVLDSKCMFYQTLFGVDKSIFGSDYGNKETATYPIFFHGNGHADMDWLPFTNSLEQSRVLVGIPSAGYSRHGQFLDFIQNMFKPMGTQFAFSHGQSPAQARNQIIRQALGEAYTHVLFIDDDVLVPNDIIPKLLAHDKDVVTGLYLLRRYPHQPIIFEDDGSYGDLVKWRLLSDGEEGLIPVQNAGLGCALIKTKVFQKLEDPWVTLGKPDPEGWCDDVSFFKKVIAAGFEMYCDTGIKAGHCATMIVWPHYQNGKWFTIIDTQGVKALNIPQLNFKEFEAIADEQKEQLAKRAL